MWRYYKMEKLTHWKKETNKEYLGDWSLIIGADEHDKPIYKEVIATIKKVAKQPIPDMEAIKKGKNNATKDELLVWFEELDKPMVIHAKTNFKGLETATQTPFIERWVGKRVCIYVETGVKAFGSVTNALRIKPVPKRICDVCGRVITEEIYSASMAKYGKALCSAECKEKAGL